MEKFGRDSMRTIKRYTKVKSKFIRELIQRSKWNNHKYIDELIFIKEYALGKWKPTGYTSGMYWSHIISKHKKEYDKIMSEPNPEGYKRLLEAERKRKAEIKREEKNLAKKMKLEEEILKRDWIKASGGFHSE
jgi:hypothetical protein